MLFNSIEYVVFLPVVLLLSFAAPVSFRWAILLAASYVFYMAWMPAYLALILISTIVDYGAGLALARVESVKARSACVALSLALNLGLLFTFKYYGFFSESAAVMAAAFGMESNLPILDLLLPVGISFYTFQTLSYTFEVYKRNQEPERHFGRFALYVSFFPQLVAGPIERPGNLLPQLRNAAHFQYGLAVSGMRLILWGLFKKMVLADRLAQIVNPVYDTPSESSGPVLVVATVAFAFQILCDFSAYTDIAIGSARLFGIDLMQNFRRPYSAHSIREFWQRWHVSLSTWFRDYLYIPLGGSRVGAPRHYLNLFITFAISGLWHGASWTFVLWGAYHAVLYILGELTGNARASLRKLTGLARVPIIDRAISVGITFFLVCIGWVFFRANTLDDAFTIFGNAATGWGPYLKPDGIDRLLAALRVDPRDSVIAGFALAVMTAGEYFRFWEDAVHRLAQVPRLFRWTAYLAFAFAITYFGVKDDVAFIYFQF